MTVYTVEDHVISCNLIGIPSQITGVSWTSSTTVIADGYTVNDGIFDSDTESQVSTLTISAERLAELRGFARSYSFTCKMTGGSDSRTVSAEQTIDIFSPGKKLVQLELV